MMSTAQIQNPGLLDMVSGSGKKRHSVAPIRNLGKKQSNHSMKANSQLEGNIMHGEHNLMNHSKNQINNLTVPGNLIESEGFDDPHKSVLGFQDEDKEIDGRPGFSKHGSTGAKPKGMSGKIEEEGEVDSQGPGEDTPFVLPQIEQFY